jgi:hypothetical protein
MTRHFPFGSLAGRVCRVVGALTLLMSTVAAQSTQAQPQAAADPPPGTPLALTTISPSGRTDVTVDTVAVTLTGTGFDSSSTLVFAPSGYITATDIVPASTKLTATFTIAGKATGVVKVAVKTGNQMSATQDFDTGVVCLDAVQSGGCLLRWQIETTTASGNSNGTSTKTTPNILFKLDFQWHSPKNQPLAIRQAREQLRTAAADLAKASNQVVATQKPATAADRELLVKSDPGVLDARKLLCIAHTNLGLQPPAPSKASCPEVTATATEAGAAKVTPKPSLTDHLATHLFFESGYTQVLTGTKLQPTNSSATPSAGNTPTSSAMCPTASSGTNSNAGSNSNSGSNPSTPSMCTAATQQQAFVANAGASLGWAIGRNGKGGVFTDIGFAARGSFQYLIPSNQLVQGTNGLSYIDFSSVNPKDVVGIYEATAHFKVSQINHDQPASSNGNYHNVSNVLTIEAGYQNNSGLQHLAGNPNTSTRDRFVGRFYINPEIPDANHTTATVGMEYSSGLNGGAHTVQIFIGGNLNPLKLTHPDTPAK